ncbi:hypothetical protein SGPA1_10977 [Streptomyces misionensis JCM 4497]
MRDGGVTTSVHGSEGRIPLAAARMAPHRVEHRKRVGAEDRLCPPDLEDKHVARRPHRHPRLALRPYRGRQPPAHPGRTAQGTPVRRPHPGGRRGGPAGLARDPVRRCPPGARRPPAQRRRDAAGRPRAHPGAAGRQPQLVPAARRPRARPAARHDPDRVHRAPGQAAARARPAPGGRTAGRPGRPAPARRSARRLLPGAAHPRHRPAAGRPRGGLAVLHREDPRHHLPGGPGRLPGRLRRDVRVPRQTGAAQAHRTRRRPDEPARRPPLRHRRHHPGRTRGHRPPRAGRRPRDHHQPARPERAGPAARRRPAGTGRRRRRGTDPQLHRGVDALLVHLPGRHGPPRRRGHGPGRRTDREGRRRGDLGARRQPRRDRLRLPAPHRPRTRHQRSPPVGLWPPLLPGRPAGPPRNGAGTALAAAPLPEPAPRRRPAHAVPPGHRFPRGDPPPRDLVT